ncbi:MAG: hypothetical protein QG657_5310 [Acidobacteriota bacterium]|nr:hypothetical protein [Acidobacteriota bacterium]
MGFFKIKPIIRFDNGRIKTGHQGTKAQRFTKGFIIKKFLVRRLLVAKIKPLPPGLVLQ